MNDKNNKQQNNDTAKLNKAIEHCLDIARQCEAQPETPGADTCKSDHIQLAAWLKELVELREYQSDKGCW